MIRALLDHCSLLKDRATISRDARILNEFDNLVKSESLEVVRFVSREDYDTWRADPPPGRDKVFIERTIKKFVRWDGSDCEAIPVPAPADLSPKWRCGLRDAVVNSDSWRSPQIVVPSHRYTEWPRTMDVEVRLEQCDNAPPKMFGRILVVGLEAYGQHSHARADANPWDLRHVNPASPGSRVNHPCLLPRPPELKSIALSDLSARMANIESDRGVDYLYYIPESDWSALSIDMQMWRQGRTFPRRSEGDKHGPVDRKGRIWHWDRNERHWDVQLGGALYYRVSHTGKVL